MLNIKTAKTIKKAIDEKIKQEILTLEDVCRMEPVPVFTGGSGYTILATQYGDMTILVWIRFNETLGVTVHKVETVTWE